MGVQERKNLIATLERELDARVLTVITGDRQGMETRIAPDILPLISEHLSSIGTTERLALFLYTPGGDSIAGWGVVNLLRQYCDKLKVLIPFRALSCGTLIVLGADEILMGRNGLLSPIDPSVNSPFNPPAPGSEKSGRVTLLPLSVEDMVGFLELARSEVGLKTEESMVEVLKILSNNVNPLALGAVYRAREQNASLARRLLSKHLNDKAKVDRIVKRLTQELPTHNYLIGHREASDELELPLSELPHEVSETMWALYKEYENWLELTKPASAELDLGLEDQKQVHYERATIESLKDQILFQHMFITDKHLVRIKVTPPGTQTPVDQIRERIIYQGWRTARDGEVL